jgi:hypothetical protein
VSSPITSVPGLMRCSAPGRSRRPDAGRDPGRWRADRPGPG